MFCIVLADRPHGSCKRSAWKRTFLKPGLRVEKSENAVLLSSCVNSESTYFAYQWRHHPPLTSSLWPLNPRRLITTTTTTMADYMLVFILQKILSLLGLLRQNVMLLCHNAEWKKIMDNYIRHIICVQFLLLLSVCIQPASFMCIFFSAFGEFQAPPIGWNMN